MSPLGPAPSNCVMHFRCQPSIDAIAAVPACAKLTTPIGQNEARLGFQAEQTGNKYQLLVRSSLVASSSALPDSCQPRPDATLTESVQFDDFIQLSRGSFAAYV